MSAIKNRHKGICMVVMNYRILSAIADKILSESAVRCFGSTVYLFAEISANDEKNISCFTTESEVFTFYRAVYERLINSIEINSACFVKICVDDGLHVWINTERKELPPCLNLCYETFEFERVSDKDLYE